MKIVPAAVAIAASLALACADEPPSVTSTNSPASAASNAGAQAANTDRDHLDTAGRSTPTAQAAAEPDAPGDPALPGIERPNAAWSDRLRAALDQKGKDYEPRTRHLEADSSPKYTNRLILESSPYLLQHAHNPVNWYAWGEAAFARAKREGKPVLLSIGYSTCHWCHVMERESFEDEEIATFLNQHYVAIKVDREERPDLDDVYMQAVQIMTGGGGWPMTVMLTPDRQPFFGGTYFPPRDGVRGAQQGFLTILRELSAVYERDPVRVVEQAQQLSARMRDAARAQPPSGMPDGKAVYLAASRLARAFDPVWGGFGRAPKFPQPSAHELLLRYYRRTNDGQALTVVTTTLEKMAAGGIYDQVGGGFHRYSTDRQWLVPHFEKMLYDNAQLACLYLDAYQITRREDFARIVRETLDYVAREMTSGDGAFYSATDADSERPDGEHEEGWFFTWTAAEIDALLGAERARLVRDAYGVTDAGNFENGRNILYAARPLDEAAKSAGVAPDQARARLDEARRILYDARAKRPAPLRDEKILTAWNALMISAFARAGFVLERSDYVERAARAADFVLTRLRGGDGRLLRSFKDRPSAHAGYLEDYAFFVQALLDLYESTSQARWLESALALQAKLDDGYYDDEAGGYFMTGADQEALILRNKPASDWAEPSGNSVAALNLLRLAEITAREDLYARAESTLEAFAPALAAGSTASTKLLAALDFYLDEPLEVLIVGEGDRDGAAGLLDAARAVYFPNRFFAMMPTAAEAERQVKLIPLLTGKKALDGRATAYVCKRGTCQRPTSDPAIFTRQLVTVDPLAVEGELPALPVASAAQ